MCSLLAHHGSWDPLFFTTHFVEGLSHDIKVVVMLHRPPDLETAVSLTALQEEVVEMVRQEHESMGMHRVGASKTRSGRFSAMPPSAVTVPTSPVMGRTANSTPSPTALDTRRGSTSPSHQWMRSSRPCAHFARCVVCVLLVERDGTQATLVLLLCNSMLWKS